MAGKKRQASATTEGQPETITKMEHDGQIATTYHDLDDTPKASTPEEAKRLAEHSNGEK